MKTTTTKASVLVVVGRLLIRSMDVVALMVLTRILTPTDFGIIAMAKTIVLILEAVTELPIASALIRQNKITDQMLNTALTLGIIRGLLITIVILIIAYPLASFYSEPRVTYLMIAISLGPLFRGISSPKIILLIKQMDFKRQLLQDGLGKFIALVLSILYAVIFKDYWALVIMTVAAPAFSSTISFILSPMKFKPTLSEWGLFKDIIGWNFLSQVFNAINWQTQRLLMPRFVDTKSFGFYSIYDDFIDMAYQTVLVPIHSPVSVSFQQAYSQNTLTQKYNLTLNIIFTLVAPIYGFIACFPNQTILFFLGEKWLEYSYILKYLAIFAIIALPSTLTASIANILYQNKSYTFRVFIELAVNIPITIFAVKYYGVNGALLARLVLSIFIAIVSINMAKTFVSTGFKMHLLLIGRPTLALILTYIFFSLMSSNINALGVQLNILLTLFLLGLLYVGFYTMSLILFWILFGKKDGFESFVLNKINKLMLNFVKYLLTKARCLQNRG